MSNFSQAFSDFKLDFFKANTRYKLNAKLNLS